MDIRAPDNHEEVLVVPVFDRHRRAKGPPHKIARLGFPPCRSFETAKKVGATGIPG